MTIPRCLEPALNGLKSLMRVYRAVPLPEWKGVVTMEFRQVYTPGLAHCSYVIGGKNECVVVDPSRSVDRYIQIAESLKLPITAIIETHLHADFISGHVELARRTGAKIYISAQARAEFEHYPVGDEEEFRIDTLLFKMLDTPGHTPEGSVFIVSDLERGKIPALLFSGDTLLVGDAGQLLEKHFHHGIKRTLGQ